VDLQNLIIFLIIGAVAGWIAGMLMRGGGFGVLGNIVVGVIGALIGGFLFSLLGITAGGLVGSLVTAVAGAAVGSRFPEMRASSSVPAGWQNEVSRRSGKPGATVLL